MKMMPTVSASMTARTITNCHVWELALRIASCDGIWLMIETKISSDIPLPMPRWVINSPNHISSAVPAVMVATMMTTLRKL